MVGFDGAFTGYHGKTFSGSETGVTSLPCFVSPSSKVVPPPEDRTGPF